MSEHNSAKLQRGRLRVLVPGTRTHAQPVSKLVAMLETTDPLGTAAVGLSSAAMRAADLVRSMRREAGFSQERLAAQIGVSQGRISELEAGRGQQGPTWDVMDRIAKACGRELGTVSVGTTATSVATSVVASDPDTSKMIREDLDLEMIMRQVKILQELADKLTQEGRRLVNQEFAYADAFKGQAIEARATSEETVVSKETRVIEEIGLRKEATDTTRTVRETVRATKADIDDTALEASTDAITRFGHDTGADLTDGAPDGTPGNPPRAMVSSAVDKALDVGVSRAGWDHRQ